MSGSGSAYSWVVGQFRIWLGCRMGVGRAPARESLPAPQTAPARFSGQAQAVSLLSYDDSRSAPVCLSGWFPGCWPGRGAA